MGLGGLQKSLTSFGNFIESFEECGYNRPLTFTRQIFRELPEYLNSVVFHKPSIFCLGETTFSSLLSPILSGGLFSGAVFHRGKILSDFKKCTVRGNCLRALGTGLKSHQQVSDLILPCT